MEYSRRCSALELGKQYRATVLLNEKSFWKTGEELGFYVAVRIWDLFSFLFWQNSLGYVFFSSNSNSLYKCYFKLPCVYIIMSLKKKLFVHFLPLNSVILGIFKDRTTVFETHTKVHTFNKCDFFNVCCPTKLDIRQISCNTWKISQEDFYRDSPRKSKCEFLFLSSLTLFLTLFLSPSHMSILCKDCAHEICTLFSHSASFGPYLFERGYSLL